MSFREAWQGPPWGVSFGGGKLAQNPRRVSFRNAWKAQYLRKVSFGKAWNAKTLGGCRLEAANCLFWYYFGQWVPGSPDAPNGQFDIVFNHYGPKAVQMLQMASLRIILDHFGPRAAQMFEVISFGATYDNFGCLKKSTYFK